MPPPGRPNSLYMFTLANQRLEAYVPFVFMKYSNLDLGIAGAKRVREKLILICLPIVVAAFSRPADADTITADTITDYAINFTTAVGSPGPSSGSFAYDSTTNLFTNFQVTWNGNAYNLAAEANSPLTSLSGCAGEASSPAYGLNIMLKSLNCGGLTSYVWSGFASQSVFDFLAGTSVGDDVISATGIGTGTPTAFGLYNATVTGVSGAIGGSEVYYSFLWGGGAFDASTEFGLTPLESLEDSYFFTMGTTASQCTSQASEILSSADGFAGNITSSNLPAGTYCIGFDPFTGNIDPTFAITFNTPVEGVSALTPTPVPTPEPSTFVLLSFGLGMIGVHLLARRRRERALISPQLPLSLEDVLH